MDIYKVSGYYKLDDKRHKVEALYPTYEIAKKCYDNITCDECTECCYLIRLNSSNDNESFKIAETLEYYENFFIGMDD